MDEENTQKETAKLKTIESSPESNNDDDEYASCWTKMTMEPLWFGAIVSLTMGFSAFQNQFIQRACLVDLGYSKEVCFQSNGTAKRLIEMQSQQVVSSISSKANLFGGAITCIMIMFLGPWSDSSGRRKPLILLSIAGMIVTSLSLLGLQIFPKASVTWAIYLEIMPLAIGGSKAMLMMATFNYIGDISFKTGRCMTTLMGSNSASISAASIIGAISAPFLLRSGGFVGVFGVSAVLETFSLLFALWKVKDLNPSKKIPSPFNLTLPVQAVKCFFKQREGPRRKNVMLMVLLPCTTTFTFATEMVMLYMYLRYSLEWTELEYGFFSAFRGISQFTGTIIIIKLLKHGLKLHDETIGLIGALSSLASASTLILANSTSVVFLAPIFGILGRGALIAEKPILNKQIVASEQGKLNAVTALADRCLSFVVLPMAQYMYSKTISWCPNCFLFLSVFAAVLQVLSYSSVTVIERKLIRN